MVRKVLLVCGILSSLIYVGTDIAAALSWEAYSYREQSISELMARGAPTRPLMACSYVIYNLLVIALGAGVLMTRGAGRAFHVTGWLLLVYGFIGYVGLFIFPLPPPGTEGMARQAVHLHEAATGAIVLCLILAMGFGGAAGDKGFRFYSTATILAVIVFGLWTALDVPLKEANLPTPWLGIKERVNVYSTMLWILVFSVGRWREEKE